MRQSFFHPTLWVAAGPGSPGPGLPLPDLSWLAWFALVPLLLVMPRHPSAAASWPAVFFCRHPLLGQYRHDHLRAPAPVLSVLVYLLSAPTWRCSSHRHLGGLSAQGSAWLPLCADPAVFWVALEFLREFLLTGFPWAALGYSQHANTTLLQSAELFGVYGLSYLLVLSIPCWPNCGSAAGRRGDHRSSPVADRAAGCRLLGYGLCNSRGSRQPSGTAQGDRGAGNIPQNVKWLPEYQQETLNIT